MLSGTNENVFTYSDLSTFDILENIASVGERTLHNENYT